MNNAVRRRLALGGVVTAGALVASVLITPAFAAPAGLSVDPGAVFNDVAAASITLTSTDADQRYGALATFTRNDGPATFTVEIDPQLPVQKDTTGTAVVDLTDLGDGVGADGPADAGTYRVSIDGAPAPLPLPGAGGGGNDTCASCFTVLPSAALSVTSVAPSSLRPAQSLDVSVVGTGFTRGSKIEFLNGSVVDPTVRASTAPTTAPTADGITTPTQLRRRLVVDAGAAPGVRNVQVRQLDGTTVALCTGCFTVAGPDLTSVTPSGGNNRPTTTRQAITVTGPSIVDGALSLEFQGQPGDGAPSRAALAVPTTRTSYSTTSLSATADLSDAAPGIYQPVVRGPNGVVNACTCRFTVLQDRAPAITGVDRTGTATGSSQAQGTTQQFDVTGSGFSKGATVAVSGTGVTTTQVLFVSETLLRVTLQTTATAATGARSVTVTLTDGKTVTRANALTITPAGPAGPATPTATVFDLGRFAGSERYDTAAKIALGTFPGGVSTVLLANGQNDDPRTSRNESHFPDALAGAYLAGDRQAPTLLATETTLPPATTQALSSLRPTTVIILGGTSAISAGVEAELRRSYTVQRIGGVNRYATAQLVAQTPATSTVGLDPQRRRTAVVASGQAFPDALVAGPLGYAARFPVLITPTAGLVTETRNALRNLDISHVVIPGGTAAVSAAVERQINDLGITTERFAGQTRSETATRVAAYAYDRLGFDRTHVDLARGDQFADALAGGPHAGVQRAPILLTESATSLGAVNVTFLRGRARNLLEGEVFGGTSAVSLAVEQEAERAVRDGQ